MTTYPRPPFVFLALVATLLLAPACERTVAEEAPKRERETKEGSHEEHALRLSEEQLNSFEIRLGVASPGTVDPGIELLGEVRPNGDRLAHIVPRYPGIAREVRKTIGDAVKSGETLAVIESSESLGPYDLKTLIDGIILEKHLTRGEAVDREKQAFVVADLSTVWIDLSVYQKDIPRVRLGQEVRVRSTDGSHEDQGKVSYVTPAVDPLTRTATARVVLSNADGHWRPGMFITARALAPVEVPLVVPRSALQTLEGKSVVFVDTKDGLAPRAIALGRQGDAKVEVVSGLLPGERIAETNTFLLKAELGKGEAEHED